MCVSKGTRPWWLYFKAGNQEQMSIIWYILLLSPPRSPSALDVLPDRALAPDEISFEVEFLMLLPIILFSLFFLLALVSWKIYNTTELEEVACTWPQEEPCTIHTLVAHINRGLGAYYDPNCTGDGCGAGACVYEIHHHRMIRWRPHTLALLELSRLQPIAYGVVAVVVSEGVCVAVAG